MKRIIYLAVTVIVLVILYATNPKEYQFKEYIKEDLKSEAVEEGGVSGAIKEIVSVPESWFMGLTVDRNNFYLFSVYEVDRGNMKYRYIGVFNTFFRFSSKKI